MTDIFSIIRRDGEFVHSVSAIEEQLRANNPLPIAINGLQGGAVSAYLVESVREVRRLSGMPVLILVRDDAMAVNTVERLSDGGLRALRFKSREPVFHNISASADVDRERLSVLISVPISMPTSMVLFSTVISERAILQDKRLRFHRTILPYTTLATI